MRILFDIGHGGSDPGAVANGLRESECNLAVGKAARTHLLKLIPGVTVGLTREDDRTLTPQQRLKLVRYFAPDICISIHHNAAGETARGAEIYYAQGDQRGKQLAESIGKRLQATGMPWRGAKTRVANGRDYYYMIRDVNSPKTIALLTEGAFITSAQDAQMIKSGWLPKQARAIAEAVAELIPQQEGPAVVYAGTRYPAQIIDGTTWCPVRAVAEAAGLRVEYDAKTRITTLRR